MTRTRPTSQRESSRTPSAGAPGGWSAATLALLEAALREDLGAGDRTTECAVPPGLAGRARVVARAAGVLAGASVAAWLFRRLDPGLRVVQPLPEGARFAPGETLLEVSGRVAPILTGERVALNFLQRLCGVATLTRAFVKAVAGTGAVVVDTRKTTPGWRELERAAVRAGGGVNHRLGLFDAILLKENHVRAAGGVAAAWRAAERARAAHPAPAFVQIEVRDLVELEEALAAGARMILLDNFPLPELLAAVQAARRIAPEVVLEASGGVTLETARAVAETGVDRLSVGAITHSAPAADLRLLLEEVERAGARAVEEAGSRGAGHSGGTEADHAGAVDTWARPEASGADPALPDRMAALPRADAMRGLKLGQPLFRAREVDSTMRWARERVERGEAGPGAAFVARAQTAGRGRHGRSWLSPPGKGLYLTLVLPGSLSAPALTLAGAVAVAEAAERVCGVSVRIKWPNDLLAEGRKWGGLLAEAVLGPLGTAVLLGVGVNVSQGPEDFGPELAQEATSLSLASGRPVDREALLPEVLARFERRLGEFQEGGFAAVAESYRRRAAFTPGDKLEIGLEGRASWLGTFRDLDAEGRLLLEESPQPLASGTVLRVRKRGAA